jgi:hypothetical protein
VRKPRRSSVIDASIQRAPIEEAGRRFFAEERQRLLEYVAERELFSRGSGGSGGARWWRERRGRW